MNISCRWLRDIAPSITADPDAIARRLGMLGAPVEEIARPGAGLGDIIVGRVLEVRPHPDADRLSLCQVETGSGEPLQVVCGAPVIQTGGLYPFAPAGATLPGGMQLRRAKIRGEYSNGMLCSEKELGLGKDQAGIMRLPDELAVGEPLVAALGLDDVRLTLEVTPNRPDLLSHVGVARELAPGGHGDVRPPAFPDQEASSAPEPRLTEGGGHAGPASVAIEDPVGCPRYMAAVVRGVTVGPSPHWLAARLRAIGQRPINNVVDATNYVLHELGQPLHAFDLDTLNGPAILVRRARTGETLVTLDDVGRKLDESMLVIADAVEPVAVAGVMGGAGSEVGAGTSNVLLECAIFDPRSVRSTARALGLSTDASYRFERGADIEGLPAALDRAVTLILAVAGGAMDERGADVYPAPVSPPVVRLRVARVARVLGVTIPEDEVVALLGGIGFELRDREDGTLGLVVPGFRRHDVTREVDLIEEVARRHGYDRLDDALRPYLPTAVPEAGLSALEDRVRAFLVGSGLMEARSIPMAPESAGHVRLLRPLSAEESTLRSTLVHGLLRAAERNLARGVRDVRLFELGTTFHPGPAGEQPVEETRVAIVLTGGRRPRHWSGPVPDWDLWDGRGLAESLGDVLGGTISLGPADADDARGLVLPDLYQPGSLMGLSMDGDLVGVTGRVEAVDAPAWAAPVVALELRLSGGMANRPRPTWSPVPSQPASDRDLALLVPDSLPAGRVAATIREAAGPLLERLDTIDLYTGSGVPAGTRSIAYRLVFRHRERTLKDREVNDAIDRVLERVRDDHGVERRG